MPSIEDRYPGVDGAARLTLIKEDLSCMLYGYAHAPDQRIILEQSNVGPHPLTFVLDHPPRPCTD
jgi:hypothetical protein